MKFIITFTLIGEFPSGIDKETYEVSEKVYDDLIKIINKKTERGQTKWKRNNI